MSKVKYRMELNWILLFWIHLSLIILFYYSCSDFTKNASLDHFLKRTAAKEAEILESIGYDIFVPNPICVIISMCQTHPKLSKRMSEILLNIFPKSRINESIDICVNILIHYPDVLSIFQYDVLLVSCMILHLSISYIFTKFFIIKFWFFSKWIINKRKYINR